MRPSPVLSLILLRGGLTPRSVSLLGECYCSFPPTSRSSPPSWNYFYTNAISVPVEITAAGILLTFWDADVRFFLFAFLF